MSWMDRVRRAFHDVGLAIAEGFGRLADWYAWRHCPREIDEWTDFGGEA